MSSSGAHCSFRHLLFVRGQELLRKIYDKRPLLDGDDISPLACTRDDDYCLYRLKLRATRLIYTHYPCKRVFRMGRPVLLACIYMLATHTTYFVVLQNTKRQRIMEFPALILANETTHRLVLSTYKYNSNCLLIRDMTEKSPVTLWHYAGILLVVEKLTTPWPGELLPLHNVNTVVASASMEEIQLRMHSQFSDDSDILVHLFTLDMLRANRIHFNIDSRRIIDSLSLDGKGHLDVF